MSQAVITKAFVEWKAQQAVDNKPVTLDEFIFAFIPELDIEKPIDDTETTPPADKIVHRQAVSKSGVINGDSVVYSVTLGADVGDFDFNWIGLVNKANGTLAMIIHAPTQRKIKNASGQQGNVLVRSMLMQYSGAEAATNITTPAETWQIDFTARLASMDERQRVENIDLYGAAAFFDTGYLVGKNNTQYFVTKGAGYVAGLRTELLANQNIAVSTKPVKVWLDVSWTGTLTSVWTVKSKITVAANLSNYVEGGVQHYVFALASIDANGNITDLRPKGSLDDQAASDALKKHEQSRNHPDATTGAKGFVQLSSATNSDSEALAATPKAVKAANDNANGRVPSGRKINGRALTGDISVTAQDIFNGQAVGIGDAADLNTFTTPGLYYQPANAAAGTGKNYPEAVAGSLEVYKHAGITQIYRVYNSSRSYIRTLYGGAWTAWTKQYDTANKPSAGDIGAVAKAGDAMTGKLTVNIDGETILLRPKTVGAASYIISRDSSGANHWYVGAGSTNNADAVFNNYKGGNNNVQLKTDGSVTLNPVKGKSVIANGPVQIGGIGNAILSIGDNDSGLRNSKDGQVDLWANGKMFGYWNTTTFSFTGQIIPTNYSNFDARYYTKTLSDSRYYTKTQSDAGYQKKGNYVTAVRFGASAEYQERGNTERMKGGVMTSWADRGSSNYWMRVRPLQYQINGGSWVTAAYA
ncbi:phage tail protein [Enterobacter hormaechei]|uniref:phage tail-collar fiber domain-containing protein n=1 Tax=Enterobacter hormaechei TaxID=158836 RepID=UPI00254AB133|nr:phage tail protein [Enterobacter hormaechei]MDK9635077.1 phage tail protein [Enterobacter hormaechei]